MNNFEIVALGYRFKFYSTEKILYYKMTMDSVEYLVSKRDTYWYCAKWLTSNEMKFIEFDALELAEIEMKMSELEPNDTFLDYNEENSFFTLYEIIKPEKIAEPKRENMTYTSDEVTTILEVLSEFDLVYTEKQYKPITKDMADYADDEYDSNVMDELVGYEVKFKKDGFHKTDGQMVCYDFTLKSPEGKITKFSTEKCLMVGWNYCDELKIN
jgi:hypothetical protein